MEISQEIFEDTKTAFAAKTDGELQKAKALFTLMGNNFLVKIGSSLAHFALGLHLPVSPLFRWTVYDHFCGGETFEECKPVIQKLGESDVGVLLNYGVELKETEEDFDKTLEKNIEAIEFAAKHRAVKAICIKPTGYGRMNLFEKIQKKETLSASEKKEFDNIKDRFRKLCTIAEKNSVALYFDAEESWIQDTLDSVVDELMVQYNKKQCIVFNTVQLYRWDRLEYLLKDIEKAKTGNYLYGVKLVRGAYMEKEREHAGQTGYQSPIHKNKDAVDKDFDQAVNLCLENIANVYICIGSHSEESNLLAMQQIEKKKIPRNSERIVFSQLYGMSDNITFNLAKLGFNATKYLPYGPIRDVVPYLIRRAQENTSVAGQTGRELSLIKREIERRKCR